MSKKYKDTSISILERNTKRMLEDAFFRLWMNRYKFPELNRKQKRFIMKEFWNQGTVGCGQVKHAEAFENKADSLVFCPYMTEQWDCYYEPEIIQFVNLRGVAFIPKGPQTLYETAAIGWATSGRNPLKRTFDYFIERMVNIELCLNTSVLANQVPFMINVSPVAKEKAQDLITKIFNHEPVIFTEGDINAIQALMTGAPWIADKMRALYYDYQGMAYTLLGIDNTKFDGSNKQFQLTEEIDANIAEINGFANDMDTCMQEFLDDIEDTFGIHISMENNFDIVDSLYDQAQDDETKQPSKEGESDE